MMAPFFANSNFKIKTSKGVHGKSAYDFIGQSKLSAGQSANIEVQIVDLKKLASAVITCQLVNCSDKSGSPLIKSVPVKFSVPVMEPQKGDITATIKKVQFAGATNELSCEVAFKNISNHAVSLSSLKFNLEFAGAVKGKISKSNQELFNQVNILEPGKTVDVIPITIKFDREDIIENLKFSVGTNNLSLTVHVVLETGESIFDLINQPTKLTSPDIEEVGPKQGSTAKITMTPTLELNKNKANEYQAIVKFKIHNTSSHPLDLSQANFSISFDGIKNGNQLTDQFKLFKSTAMLQQNESTDYFNYPIGLGNITLTEAEDYLTRETYSFTMTIKTLDGTYQLETSTQQVALTK